MNNNIGKANSMDIPQAEKIVQILDSVRQRPAMYMGSVHTPVVIAFLHGFQAAYTAWDGVQPPHLRGVWQRVQEERGWYKEGGYGIAHSMQKRGLSESQIAEELLTIEIIAWERLGGIENPERRDEGHRWPSDQEWLASLQDTDRARADALIRALERVNAPTPITLVRAEIQDGKTETARYLFLRRVRRQAVEDYQFSPKHGTLTESLPPTATLEASRAAFERLIASGADLEDILRVARGAACEAVMTTLDTVDTGHEEDLADEVVAPRWALMEISGPPDNPNLTGRKLNGLYDAFAPPAETDEE